MAPTVSSANEECSLSQSLMNVECVPTTGCSNLHSRICSSRQTHAWDPFLSVLLHFQKNSAIAFIYQTIQHEFLSYKLPSLPFSLTTLSSPSMLLSPASHSSSPSALKTISPLRHFMVIRPCLGWVVGSLRLGSVFSLQNMISFCFVTAHWWGQFNNSKAQVEKLLRKLEPSCLRIPYPHVLPVAISIFEMWLCYRKAKALALY